MIPYQIFTYFYMCIQEIVQTVKMLVPFCQVHVHLHDFKAAVSMSVTILMELRMLESPWTFVNVRPSFRRMKHCNVHLVKLHWHRYAQWKSWLWCESMKVWNEAKIKMKGKGSDCATVKVTMLPILSSATQPVKPVLNRDADNFASFSAPPEHSSKYCDTFVTISDNILWQFVTIFCDNIGTLFCDNIGTILQASQPLLSIVVNIVTLLWSFCDNLWQYFVTFCDIILWQYWDNFASFSAPPEHCSQHCRLQ